MNTLGILGGLLSALAFIPYTWSILRGKTKPSKSTWFIWMVLDWLLFWGMYAQNAINFQISVTIIGATLTAMLSIKYGTLGWSKIDTLCMCGAVIGIVGWLSFNNPNMVILAALTVITIGMIPTVRSVIIDPNRENKPSWLLASAGSLLTVLSVQDWNFAHAAQPIVFFLESSLITLLLYFPIRPLQP